MNGHFQKKYLFCQTVVHLLKCKRAELMKKINYSKDD